MVLQIRVRYEKPWSVRDATRRLASIHEPTSMVLRRVPELAQSFRNGAHEHDMGRWQWLLRIASIQTTTIIRVWELLRLLHLTAIRFPRLVAENFRIREDLNEALHASFNSTSPVTWSAVNVDLDQQHKITVNTPRSRLTLTNNT